MSEAGLFNWWLSSLILSFCLQILKMVLAEGRSLGLSWIIKEIKSLSSLVYEAVIFGYWHLMIFLDTSSIFSPSKGLLLITSSYIKQPRDQMSDLVS